MAAQPNDFSGKGRPSAFTHQPKTADPARLAPRFRVRSFGTLRLNGEVYQAGEELALTEAEVTALACPAIERF